MNAIPGDDQLLDDARSLASALGDLYRARAKRPLPFEVPELVALEDAAEDAAGKKRPARGLGFRQSKEERDLIENRAVDLAAACYKADGWKVRKRGYDLQLRRGSERLTVEVKGTTSMGEAVPLTYGEVRHHAKGSPNNALVVVRGIVLDRSTSPPTVSGGVLFERRPVYHRRRAPGHLLPIRRPDRSLQRWCRRPGRRLALGIDRTATIGCRVLGVLFPLGCWSTNAN